MMKIVFSRKGFDSSYGGFPSPIFPDGTLFSIPIPDKKASFSYKDLNFSYKGESIQKILNDLTNQKIQSGKKHNCDYNSNKFKCHFDPMIIENERYKGLVLGQSGSAASHLMAKKIQKGDIFLFFGWFKEIIKINNKWQYKKGAKYLHVLWGYMEVEEVVIIHNNIEEIINQYPFLVTHPHIEEKRKNLNIIFISQKYKRLKYNNKTILTNIENYQGRSYWNLPKFFNYPNAFSFLKDFKINNNNIKIKIPNRGQEFVLDLNLVLPKDKRNILDYINSLI